MSESQKLEHKKLDLKKLKLQIELESNKNIRWIIFGSIILGVVMVLSYLQLHYGFISH